MSGPSCELDPPNDGWNMLDMNAILQYGALRLSPIPFRCGQSNVAHFNY